ncbi:hypothetical protein E2493_17665 [Sphingomonas parva]|uniref:DUF1190 domain-containing protein n=1 Tax=Sphingomonas parva TaxID=2555898 RepID=A0A4Y8ZLR6_9SPHN|nr:hypothetical protein [Sphingomonas parva]TFI56951.1 hypothetical protein E2493_17665 [Sphingomonas parva]
MKKQLSMTTAMATALLALPACSSNDDWNGDVLADRDTAVCVDQQGKRVDDDLCDDDRDRGGSGVGNAFLWYYIGRNSALPYYGDSIYDRRFAGKGSFSRNPSVAYGRAPKSTAMTRSQAVSRGGLGSSARSFGGSRS